MTKQLIIGLATLSIAGTAFLGSSMYAATSTNIGTNTQMPHMEQRNPTAMLTTIKSKLSTEAYTALETLVKKHKTEMDALKTSTTTISNTTIKAKHGAFKTEMDALLVKYPEIKAAMPQGLKMGNKGGQGNMNPMNQILSGVSATDKTAIEAIHTEYRTKQEALRTEEKAKVGAIIAKYPELKSKLDALEASRPQMDDKHDGKRGGRGMMKNTKTTNSTAQ
jgi:type IV pilus biogenesis protein CpaD/CtpE